MRLRHRREGASLLVHVEGDLDVRSAEAFREEVDRRLDEAPVKNLVVNLEKVGFIDSTGLGAILGRYRRLAGAGGRMALVAPPPAALAVLRMGGVPDIMPVYASDEAAMGVTSP